MLFDRNANRSIEQQTPLGIMSLNSVNMFKETPETALAKSAERATWCSTAAK
jgi:L,D-peptidoglycan transpeptidase YkuD (ErfK/YbiS/YcfS/YnhG family)